MAFAPLFDPTQQFMARSGAPLAGGLLYVYRNTSQSLATLKNVAGTTIANPVSLDADGRAAGGVFVSDASTYTLVVKDAYEATLWTIAAMSPIGGGSGGGGSEVTITPTITTGTKIADYSIDGEAGELYAPNGGGGVALKTCIVKLEISGSFNSSNGRLWDGVITEGITIQTTYKGADDVDVSYKPSFWVDSFGRIFYSAGALCSVIALNVSAFLNTISGFNREDAGYWGMDSTATQMAGNMYRTFDVSHNDQVMSNGFRLSNSLATVSDTFKVIAIGSFLAPA